MTRGHLLAAALVLALGASARAGDVDPQRAFGGTVKANGDGTLTLAYDFDAPAELRDWEDLAEAREGSGHAWVKDGVLEVRRKAEDFAYAWLKVPFSGDTLVIETRARTLAPDGKELLIRLYGPEEAVGYRVALGYPFEEGRGSYIWKFPGELLKKISKPEFPPGEWHDVAVKVNSRSIALTVKNAVILRVNDDAFRSGRLGFGTFGSSVAFDSIRITGRVDPNWIEKNATAPPPPRAKRPPLQAPGEDALIDDLTDEEREALVKGRQWYADGNLEEAARAFRTAAGTARGNPLPAYFLGRALLAQGLAGDALAAFEDAARQGRDLPWVFVWTARARRAARPGEEALRAAADDLRRAAAADASHVDTYFELAEVHLHLREYDAALAAAQRAYRLLEGLLDAGEGDLGDVRALLEKAGRARQCLLWMRDGFPLGAAGPVNCPLGPVHSDARRQDVQDLALWLTSVSNGLKMMTGVGDLGGGRVYLLADEALWNGHRFPGLMVESGVTGTLNSVTGDLFLHYGPSPGPYFRAAADLAPRALARRFGAPPWIEEGLVGYFQAVPYEGPDRLKMGLVRVGPAVENLRALFRGDFTSLRAFVLLDRAAFDRDPNRHRSQAWSLVHFLRHHPEGDRDYLVQVFTRLSEGRRGADALGTMDFDALERSWRTHVEQMLR